MLIPHLVLVSSTSGGGKTKVLSIELVAVCTTAAEHSAEGDDELSSNTVEICQTVD
jgi:hypothetical protein